MKVIIFLLLFTLNTQAEVVSLPPSVSGINDIVAEFRNLLSTKIVDLGKNYIPAITDKTIVFTNNANLKCAGVLVNQGEAVASFQYNYKTLPGELVEKATYRGCLHSINLVEDVIVKGSKLEPLKYADFIKGKRDFDLKEGEDYKLYRLSNADNVEIFKLIIQRKGSVKIAEFFILSSPFLRLNYQFENSQSRLMATYSGYKGLYEYRQAVWEFSVLFPDFTDSVSVKKAQLNQISYFSQSGPMSQNDFLSRFEGHVTNGPIARIRKIVDFHNYFFPPTKVVQSGSGNERLKEELRIALNRLQNNTELNLVKKQLQDYAEAVENGLINDLRPKQ